MSYLLLFVDYVTLHISNLIENTSRHIRYLDRRVVYQPRCIVLVVVQHFFLTVHVEYSIQYGYEPSFASNLSVGLLQIAKNTYKLKFAPLQRRPPLRCRSPKPCSNSYFGGRRRNGGRDSFLPPIMLSLRRKINTLAGRKCES